MKRLYNLQKKEEVCKYPVKSWIREEEEISVYLSLNADGSDDPVRFQTTAYKT
jgi:hypothetical protein